VNRPIFIFSSLSKTNCWAARADLPDEYADLLQAVAIAIAQESGVTLQALLQQ
jgi:hypothetical protein